MYKGLVNALYLMNIIFQSFLNLLTPIGLGLLLSYLLTTYAGAPSWLWAVFTVLGVFAGLFSMVKFILSAMSALDRLEKEREERQKAEQKIKNAKVTKDLEETSKEGDSENEE